MKQRPGDGPPLVDGDKTLLVDTVKGCVEEVTPKWRPLGNGLDP